MALNLTNIYLHVVQDVINNVREDFISEGVDEGVLQELQSLWELKMMQSGAIQSAMERPPMSRVVNTPITPFHDLNVPYEGTEEYETPTAEMLFPPTPVPTPLPEPVMYNYLPPGSSESLEADVAGESKMGRPAPYMQQPASWLMPRTFDVNIAAEESRDNDDNPIGQPITKDFFNLATGKRKRDEYASDFYPGSYIPQQDGAADRSFSEKHRTIYSQVDGNHDNYNDGEEDYNDFAAEEAFEGNIGDSNLLKVEGGESDESEPPLNENDDDYDDLGGFGDGEDAKTEHMVVSQFEKVTKVKGKWKCILKDGIMNLNNRDYLFSKANGEFDFF